MKRKVLAHKCVPLHPIRVLYPAAVQWLFLDRFGAPGWLWGVFWTLNALMFVVIVVAWWAQEEYEPVWGDADQ